MIKPTMMNQMMFWHNDYSNPGCEVVVYHEEDCQGDGWSTGPVLPIFGNCFELPTAFGTGHSAAVMCNSGAEAEQGWVEGGKFDFEGEEDD